LLDLTRKQLLKLRKLFDSGGARTCRKPEAQTDGFKPGNEYVDAVA
jgi:hypothetical protein